MTTNLAVTFLTIVLLSVSGAAQAQWKQSTSTDQMTGKKTVIATIDSKNSLNLAFPYAGSNKGRLMIRSHPRHGLDVIFEVQKGQIMCHSDNCELLVRFDDEEPQTLNGSRSTDNSSTVVFLPNAEAFVEAARRAKRILVQATYFRNGPQVLTFQSAKPLVWSE